MANRTLRRAYNGASTNANSDVDANGSEPGCEPDSTNAESDADTDAIVDGGDNGGDSNSASSIGSVEIDPAKLGEYIANGGSDGANSDSDTPKRRGRKKGVKYGPRIGKQKAAESVAPFLTMVHTIAATMLKTPELLLEEDEAKKLSDAYSNFCQHHDIPMLSDKRLSEVQLISCAFMIYVPRLVAMRKRWSEESKVKKAKQTPLVAVI